MTSKPDPTNIPVAYPGLATSAVSQLRQEYLDYQALLHAQPPLVQRFVETQASSMAEALIQNLPQLRFTLPDRVVLPKQEGEVKTASVPGESREQLLGGLMDRLMRTDLRTALRLRLGELEQSSNRAVSLSAGLLRHAVVRHLVHNMLPAGRSVQYAVAEGEEIPSIPVQSELEPESAITAATDAIVVDEESGEAGRGELLVPYVEAARRFYLPQWVAFDDREQLLVGSVNEAEAHIASMQRYLSVLHAAVGMAPYMVADDEYQRKRYGILGQLVNQGRALARYEVQEIIKTIKRRANSNDLNRGLSLSLPYFNDQTLAMENYGFEVIPAGRIMFVPAFVVRAAREQEAKIAQDTRLSQSTRKHLLAELGYLEEAFLR
ncbi:MAG: hypothetical protein A2136_11050 [Chloroflexi bacterium RBG_16_54_11]|nr:MAG: hypothetical protein A2136_11050 [Chloroflexi bacterium RBG_16_54_11]